MWTPLLLFFYLSHSLSPFSVSHISLALVCLCSSLPLSFFFLYDFFFFSKFFFLHRPHPSLSLPRSLTLRLLFISRSLSPLSSLHRLSLSLSLPRSHSPLPSSSTPAGTPPTQSPSITTPPHPLLSPLPSSSTPADTTTNSITIHNHTTTSPTLLFFSFFVPPSFSLEPDHHHLYQALPRLSLHHGGDQPPSNINHIQLLLLLFSFAPSGTHTYTQQQQKQQLSKIQPSSAPSSNHHTTEPNTISKPKLDQPPIPFPSTTIPSLSPEQQFLWLLQVARRTTLGQTLVGALASSTGRS